MSGIQKHKSMQKAAYSMFTAYLRSCIKTRHLRSEERVETASVTISWLFQGLFSCPTELDVLFQMPFLPCIRYQENALPIWVI